MNRPQLSQILIQNASLKVVKLRESKAIRNGIKSTKKQQEDVLALKDVDKEQLKMVFQL